MKRILLTILVIQGSLSLQAQDWGKLGLKGEVEKAYVSSDEYYHTDYTLEFTTDGKVTRLALESPDGPFMLRDIATTSTGFKGTYNGMTVTVTVSGGRITAASYTSGGGNKYSLHYTYGSNGFLSKVTCTTSWTTTSHNYVQSKAKIDTQGADKILKQMQQTTDPVKLAKLQQQYQAAVKKANVKVTSGYTQKQTQTHSSSDSREFWGYKTDSQGNWTERSYTNNGYTHTQKQKITYNSTFISRNQWEQLQRSGNLGEIEQFALNTEINDEYRNKATDYWNQRIMAAAGNDIDKLSRVATSRVATSATKEQAWSIVRERIYTEQVEPETDYMKVRELAWLKKNGVDVFDETYRNRILARSQQLRTDILNDYQGQVQQAFELKDYAGASMYAKRMLEIDATNTYARNIWQESDYAIIKQREQLKSITESDYIAFLDNHAGSPHTQEIVDSRARLYTNKNLKPILEQSDINQLRGQGADPKIVNRVEHRYRHQTFVALRGRFFRLGLDFDCSIGGATTQGGAGLRARFGYICNYINFSCGFKYNYLSNTTARFKHKEDLDGGYFDRRCWSVPLELRFNFSRDWDQAGYIGFGAELNFGDLGSHYIYPYTEKGKTRRVRIKDKDVPSDKTTVSPKFTIGYTVQGFEIEFNTIYDKDSFFNKEYVLDEYNGPNSPCPLMKDAYEKQIKGEGLMSKLRFGLAMRFLF